MRKITLFSILFIASFSVLSIEYVMVKGDTLWSLSKLYLKNPYQWPSITYADGKKVTEPRRMPIGTLLLIPAELANSKAKRELKSETLNNNQKVNTNKTGSTEKPLTQIISNPSIQSMLSKLNQDEKNKLWDYYLTDNNGLVRAFYNGQEVVIEVQILIDEMRHMETKIK